MTMDLGDRRGLTLIEIMVAIAILAIIVLGALSVLGSGFRMITLSNWHNKSTFDTQTAAEQGLFIKNTNPSAAGVLITFSDGSTVTAPGELRRASQTVNDVAADIWYFQPKN